MSPMFHGGANFCKMIMGLEATIPMTNMYSVDGFQSGDYYTRSYANSHNPITMTDNHEMEIHYGKMDLFNLSRKPGGDDESIRDYIKAAHSLRDKYSEIVGPKGTLIILDKEFDIIVTACLGFLLSFIFLFSK